jgi:hypothetical protein
LKLKFGVLNVQRCKCVLLLKKYNYKILANNDHDNETFCCDGIIVASHDNFIDIPYIHLGNRNNTNIRNNIFYEI